jgi:soluble lytic murein transglycosylase
MTGTAVRRIINSFTTLALALALVAFLPQPRGLAQNASGPALSSSTGTKSAIGASGGDATSLRRAMLAARRSWTSARREVAQAGPVARAIVEWRYLLEDRSRANFDALNAFLTDHADWPSREALFERAEEAMPAKFGPADILSWYGEREPVSGAGMLRLGDALVQSGDSAEGSALIRKAWIISDFTLAEETRIIRSHSNLLGPAEQAARLHRLLNANIKGGAVTRQLARVDAATKAIGNARLKLRANPATAKALLASLSEAERASPELLIDAARALRRRGLDQDAWDLMEKIPVIKQNLPLDSLGPMERLTMARDALTEGRRDIAYRLAAAAAQSAESLGTMSEAEFLAGWIALRYLRDAERARPHFERLTKEVNLPITLARAYFWLGRSAEALKKPAEATTAFRIASTYPATFYGQLALAKLSDHPILHVPPASADPTQSDRDLFEADERVQAIRMLSTFSDRNTLRLFAVRIANDPPNATKLQLLAELMEATGDRAMSVRVAKTASYDNIYLMDHLHPMIELPTYSGQAPDPALVLGLTRQESEFDSSAVSGAGARGLMQLMPVAARQAAGKRRLPFRIRDLTANPSYNLQLGMTTINDYLNRWDGSYVLAIASYNAGPNNVRKWIEIFGDPRDANIDPIDWIESIPFPETRNYVHRVMENVGVYRNRLSGSNRKLELLTDIYRPGPANLAAWNETGAAAAPVLSAP